MSRRMNLMTIALAVALASSAQAQSKLQIDVNALTAQASGPLSIDFTGRLEIFTLAVDPDPNARILDLLIDGTRQHTGGAASDMFEFFMALDFESGSIVSGEVRVAVDAAGSENIYEALALPTIEGSILEFGGQFLIGGQTQGGVFTQPQGSILDLGIGSWGSAMPNEGLFAIIGLNPDGQGFDANADVDVYILTPAPGVLATIGLGLFATGRRRR